VRFTALAAVLAAGVLVGVARAATPALVVVRLSQDPYSDSAQHATEVEPDSAAFGSTVVATFQVGRYFDGASTNIGFAVSTDRGLTWRSGLLPALTVAAAPPGPYFRASDPSVAYDAAHGRWLIASLVLGPGTVGFVVSGSADGRVWDPPVEVVSGGLFNGEIALDKEWIACDNWTASPFRGHCYLSYSDFAAHAIATQTSTDGGRTWSAPARFPVRVEDSGPQPVVRSNGDLIVPIIDFDSVLAARSPDGGASFEAPRVVSRLVTRGRLGFRGPPFASAEADNVGSVYVAWQDCRFRPPCRANDIVLARTRDGVTWGPTTRVPFDRVRTTADHVLPGLGVDTSRPGRLAVTAYTFSTTTCLLRSCLLNVDLIASSNGGRTWTKTRRVSRRPMRAGWLPTTSAGLMVGDYISTSFAGGRAVGVFAAASAPSGGRLNQSMFAASLAVK
jgi:BNR/Asp-box repeat